MVGRYTSRQTTGKKVFLFETVWSK